MVKKDKSCNDKNMNMQHVYKYDGQSNNDELRLHAIWNHKLMLHTIWNHQLGY